jgi:Zn finger protein HypA/HybF involved in hydrogenase expression
MITIVRNAARCKKCGTTVESKSRHDYVKCPCGNVAVDGGHDYIRMVIEDHSQCELLHRYDQDLSHIEENDGS